jgi:hypothetical protein
MPRTRTRRVASLSAQQEQQLLTAYRRMDALWQRVFADCLELFERDGYDGWVRLRTALNAGLRRYTVAAQRRQTRRA